MHFDLLSVVQRRVPLARKALHRACVRVDAIAMKGRLHDAPHLPMLRFFAGEQSVAEHQTQRARAKRLYERVLLRHEHVFDLIGVIEQYESFRRETKR